MLNIKRLFILFLISFTCFLTQCNGCQDNKSNVPLKWGKLTVSCGFPAPYFDFEIKETPEGKALYSADSWENIKYGAPLNIAFIFALSWLLAFLKNRKKTDLRRLAFIGVILSLLFSTSLLYPYFPEILRQIAVYIYFYPVVILETPLKNLLSEGAISNAGPRIYFVFMTVLVYLLVSAFKALRAKIKARKGLQ